MLSSEIPTRFSTAFASGAGAGFITTPLPTAPQSGGRASLQQGFSELNFDPLASGGIPPWGKDFNGILNMITNWLRWAAAGGIPIGYDATFAAAISGYPMGAFLKAASGNHFWISTAESNATDPDAGGANWIPFPDVIVQKQAGNFAVDFGLPNQYHVTLNPATFTSISDLVGSPIRVMVGSGAGANTITNPTLQINGLTPLTMINSSGLPLLIGQIARANQIFEGYPDGLGFFQVTSPAPIVAGVAFTLPPGTITLWPNEVPPTWALECNGALLNIISYPNLFNAIGIQYGGDGVSNFRLPDYRGAFIRGWDHGRGLDPGASSRTNRGDGTTGDHNGTWQGQGVGNVDAWFANPYGAFDSGFWNDSNQPLNTWSALQRFLGAVSRFFSPQGGDAIQFSNLISMSTNFKPVNTSVAQVPPWNPKNYLMNFTTITTTGGAEAVDDTGAAVQLSKLGGTLTSAAGETRPVNVNSMFIIAY